MTPLHFKLAALLFGITLANAYCAEELSAIILGVEPTHGPGKKIVIQLLSPLEEHPKYSGGGTSEDGKVVGIRCVWAGDHGFLYTSEGELYIDNMYAGKYDAADTLQFGFNRLWANGTPCVLSKVSARQEKIIYVKRLGNNMPAQADGSCQITKGPYRIFLKPVRGHGGTRNANGVWMISNGMYVLRFAAGGLRVNGIPFGRVNQGAEIRIIDGRVSVDGAVRLPQTEKMQKEIEKDVTTNA